MKRDSEPVKRAKEFVKIFYSHSKQSVEALNATIDRIWVFHQERQTDEGVPRLGFFLSHLPIERYRNSGPQVFYGNLLADQFSPSDLFDAIEELGKKMEELN